MNRWNFAFAFVILMGWACDEPRALAQDPRFAVHIPTTYDIGDSFAAEAHRVYVAEDNGGWIEVRSVQKPDPPIAILRTGYDRGGDDIAVDDPYLYVAEDNGGRVEVHDLMQGGSLVDAFMTTFDRGDALAASMGLVFVAEDDGGLVEAYGHTPAGWQVVDRFVTSYDSGDDVAATNVAFLVAEDDGGLIEVHRGRVGQQNRIVSWEPKGNFGRTTFDRGDGLGAYILSRQDGLDLVLCVAEDNGGRVECTTRNYSSWLRF
ncbi:MAG: hypothetical protein GTO24_22400 [candidate division Zixibacteria bacterium]|nr:hypothetical protein [candidate division Zixibacteria bacterium]